MNFTVPDMSCGHCKAAIEKALTAADPSAQITVDIPARHLSVTSTLSADAVLAELTKAGYDAQPA